MDKNKKNVGVSSDNNNLAKKPTQEKSKNIIFDYGSHHFESVAIVLILFTILIFGLIYFLASPYFVKIKIGQNTIKGNKSYSEYSNILYLSSFISNFIQNTSSIFRWNHKILFNVRCRPVD